MPFKQVNELRKKEKLDEALEMANQDMESHPENIWNKRAASWVYYEYLKKYSYYESFDAFKATLLKLKELHLPEEEKMVFDNSAWQIGSLIFSLQRQNPVSYSKINNIFEIIKDFHFTRPSKSYSFLYKAFHKGYKEWSKYLEFADWWDFKNFQTEDYLKDEFKGKKIMSLVQQACIAYSKKLLEGEPAENKDHQYEVNRNKIRQFLPYLDNIIDNHPEYQYPPYFKAKLLLAIGDQENILSAFLPFARQKRNDFWVWDIMAEIFKNEKEIQLSCFCKALSIKTQEDFLVKIRQKFAKLLIEKEMYVEAKFEIGKVIETRNKHGWAIPPAIKEWEKKEWYTSVNDNDNKELYENYKTRAEEILYQDIEEDIVAVEFVNSNKKILNFIINKDEHGFFKYPSELKNPKVGDILKVRFNKYSKDSISKIYTGRKISPDTKIDAIKKFEGWFQKIPNKNFGFVDDIFVNSEIINKYSLSDSQILKGKAILSYDKKKKNWGWKVFDILKP